MQAFCNKCGQELPSYAAVCSLCGEPQSTQEAPQYAQPQQYQPTQAQRYQQPPQQYQPPQQQQYQPQAQQFQPSQQQQYQPQTQQYQQPQPQQYQPQAQQPEFPQSQYEGYAPAPEQPMKGVNKKVIGIIAGAVAVVIILVVVIAVFAGNESPEVVAEKYISAGMSFDYQTMKKYSAADLDSAILMRFTLFPESMSDAERRQRIDAEYARMREEFIDNMKNEYGVDFKMTTNPIGVSYLSDFEMRDKIDAYRGAFSGYYGIFGNSFGLNELYLQPLEEAEEMCIVNMRMTIEGSWKRDSNTVEILCVKIGGKWKVFG